MRDMRNQRNWLTDAESSLVNQHIYAAEEANQLKAQLADQKVRAHPFPRKGHAYRFSVLTGGILCTFVSGSWVFRTGPIIFVEHFNTTSCVKWSFSIKIKGRISVNYYCELSSLIEFVIILQALYDDIVEHQQPIVTLVFQAQQLLEHNKPDFTDDQLHDLENLVTDIRKKLELVRDARQIKRNQCNLCSWTVCKRDIF